MVVVTKVTARERSTTPLVQAGQDPRTQTTLRFATWRNTWVRNSPSDHSIFPRLNQAAKNSGSGQGLGGAPSGHGHTTAANKVETLKEEEEELKRRVLQCKVGHVKV